VGRLLAEGAFANLTGDAQNPQDASPVRQTSWPAPSSGVALRAVPAGKRGRQDGTLLGTICPADRDARLVTVGRP
jgi:hypothetical protein